ncbi:substrate-binding domain-containing protein [Ruminococcus flavefaciens]|uniref:Ribose transport system substrate-binding protein n=1 Tax=Ruminococcus flavefaciens TaxID=1265 RepID=A0A1M7MJJ9_RUMFL|nr:substrate-binding domain-containing protein [Ruminococcus flavefaciens]SHM91097.1 ribose transport system substrate-binding protein [Ruminococcus flavefaciens]
MNRSKRKGIFRTIAACTLSAMMLISAGCGKPQNAGGNGQQGGPPAKVAVITKQQLSYWDDVKKGAEDAGNELGVQIMYTVATSDNDYVSQVAAIKEAIAADAKAIVIAPNSDTELNSVLDEAVAKGIKVININSKVKDYGKIESFIRCSDSDSGAVAARNVAKILEEKGADYEKLGKIAIIGHTASTAEERIQGFIGVLTSYASHNIQKPSVTETDPEKLVEANAAAESEYNSKLEKFSKNFVQGDRVADREKAAKEAEKLLKNDGNGISIMFGTNTNTTLGICDAVSSLKLDDKIIVVGFNSDEEELSYIRKGTLNGTVVQNPYIMGYVGVRYANKVIKGMTVPTELDVGATFVNGSNMNDDYIQLLLYPDKY